VTIAAPGHDEIILTVPGAPHLCNDRAHRNQGRPAQVIVIFGQLGVPGTPRDAFWPECWGRSYPMCATCWQATRQAAARARLHLVITGPVQP
jgi:hypothetical protein